MRRLLLLLPLLALSLLFESCQTTPAAAGTTPATALQTFDAIYANAVSADDVIVKTATAALQSGLISPAQATRVLSITDAIKSALDTANAAAVMGSTAVASGNLAAALGPIAVLSACLTIKPLTVASFDACTAKLTPPGAQP